MERKYIAFVWCKEMRVFKFKTTPKTDIEEISKEAAKSLIKKFMPARPSQFIVAAYGVIDSKLKKFGEKT